MPVLAKFQGIVMRMLNHHTFGTHLHAIYGEAELVIGLNPVRIIQGEAPPWVSARALEWVRQHECDARFRTTPSSQDHTSAACRRGPARGLANRLRRGIKSADWTVDMIAFASVSVGC